MQGLALAHSLADNRADVVEFTTQMVQILQGVDLQHTSTFVQLLFPEW